MHEVSHRRGTEGVVPVTAAQRSPARMETRIIVLPGGVSRREAQLLLSEQAEHGKWEMTRLQRFRGGARKIWLRRRTIPVRRSDVA